MNWIALPIVLPLLSALIGLMLRPYRRVVGAIGVGGSLAIVAVSIQILRMVAEHDYLVLEMGSWAAPFGITLVADRFSALMLLVCAVVSAAVAVYSWFTLEEKYLKPHYFPLFHLMLMGVNGAFLTGDLFNLYVWFEVMLLSSFVLMVLGRERDQLEGGLKYLVINVLSSLLFLCGIGLMYGKLGTLNMADVAQRLLESPDRTLINTSATLLLISFGIKAAVFPFFFWLPASYHTPPFAIAGLFAGLLTKVGVYALVRAFTLFFASTAALMQDLLLVCAALTMITGVLGAAVQWEIRRILSFHIISQIGYMVMGLALLSPLALAGAIFYIAHHIIVKTNLFLVGGVIAGRCRTSELRDCGGLYKSAPFLSLVFFIPAFSLGGIPPLSGFWAKYSVVRAGLEEHAYWLVAVALFVGVLTLYSMTKIWAEVFWKAAPDKVSTPPVDAAPMSRDRSREWGALLPCVVLAALTVWLGLWAGPLFEFSIEAGNQLLDPASYIRAVLGTEAMP